MRLPDDLAEEVEVVARAQDKSVNELIIGALSVEIDRVSKDAKFMDRVKRLVEHDREILNRLAQT